VDLRGGLYAQCGSSPSFLARAWVVLIACSAALDLPFFEGEISGSGEAEPDADDDEDAEDEPDAMKEDWRRFFCTKQTTAS
jgi:hypothetical protein